MADIYLNFPIKAPIEQIYGACTTPEGLNQWWTLRSHGGPVLGSTYQLYFAEDYDWRATVTKANPPYSFELDITSATPDWQGTKVSFTLSENDGQTKLNFEHRGWPEDNDHYRTSSFCWAMYLRLMKRYVEHGETVNYGIRLDA